MTTIRMREAAQSIGEEPERRGDERSEAPRSGGSSPIEPAGRPVPPDPEVSARHTRRRFTTAHRLQAGAVAKSRCLHPTRRARRAAPERGALLVACDHLASAA